MLSSSTSDFFALAERKLNWLDARARVLASNVANADTPGYRSHDLEPFSRSLTGFDLPLTRTDPADLAGAPAGDGLSVQIDEERAPDGNAVSMEHQMKLVADTNAQQQLTTTLYRKYVGLTMTALGVGNVSS